ncbi:MAG TPA: BON domain-containing protein [Burkholderiales bacterium]|nr:BON domain-containing protein [Burkholderiales bacterium]
MMNRDHTRWILAGVAAALLGVVGCDRNDDYGPTSSGTQSRPADQSAGSPSTLPSEPSAPSEAVPSTTAPSDRGAASGSSVGTAVEDSVITTKVKAALLADSEVKGTDINVETQQGVVQLSGVVDNKAQASKAVSLAKNVDGVKSVNNQLNVKG